MFKAALLHAQHALCSMVVERVSLSFVGGVKTRTVWQEINDVRPL